ncbi:MAG: hypothetical protein K2X27_24255 [Candidatus Obscuribacterales bacterium]|nr:hypothetical protein [Candidatus Obscuribacterales bacterium]
MQIEDSFLKGARMRQDFSSDLKLFIEPLTNVLGYETAISADPGEILQLLSGEEEMQEPQLSEWLQELKELPAMKGLYSKAEKRKRQALELSTLGFLCDYDNKNGTIYALHWASLLNRFAYCISRTGELKQKRQLWTLLTFLGSKLLKERQPKHFAHGLTKGMLKPITTIATSISTLATPLALAVADLNQLDEEPDYDSSTRCLKMLATRNFDLDDERSFQDLAHWLFNSSFLGRSGHILDRSKASRDAFASLDEEAVLAALGHYDQICKSQMRELALDFFAYVKSHQKQ